MASVNNDLTQCKYGTNCYRKNPTHFQQFSHRFSDHNKSDTDRSQQTTTTTANKKLKTCDNNSTAKHSDTTTTATTTTTTTTTPTTKDTNIFNIYLNKVEGIDRRHNQFLSVDIKDILCETMGKLLESAQFNYKFDIDWLVEQYAQPFRAQPLLVVFGDKRDGIASTEMRAQTSKYSFIKLCAAPLFDPFGTHHTKMMLLRYDTGVRVVIMTANLVPYDWLQKTQGVWISPLFPPIGGNKTCADLSQTAFKTDLLEYLDCYKSKEIDYWCNVIKRHDLSSAKVFLVASVPGRHIQEQKTKFGHLKLRKILCGNNGVSTRVVDNKWPVIAQFSSIGSLGAKPDAWLCSELLSSLSAVSGSGSQSLTKPSIKLIFPTVDDVRMSLEGYQAGTSLPYSSKTCAKQTYLKSYLHSWRSECRGRTHASPHIKSYTRVSPDSCQIPWFLLTSANLSRAAWGSLEKSGAQLAIKSFELGVLFVPKIFGSLEVFNISKDNKLSGDGHSEPFSFPLHFDIPLSPYRNDDEPWTWDEPHADKPDRHGNAWIPE